MGAKRKQTSPAVHESRKRAKGLQDSPPAASPHPHGEVDPDQLYTVRSIIDERAREYRIDWEDDPVTGEAFEPTWEPKGNVTKLAVKEWNGVKARRARERTQQAQQTREERPTEPVASRASSAGPARTSKSRARRVVVDSSPEVSPKVARTQTKTQAIPKPPPRTDGLQKAPQESEAVPEIVESQSADLGDSLPDSPLFEPIVEPSDPPSSYLAGEYQTIPSSSQAAPTSDHPLPASSAPVVSGEQSRSVPVNFGEGSSRVIPDSQTAVDLTSSAPPAVSSSRSGKHVADPEASEAIVETPAAPRSAVPVLTRAKEPSPVSRRPSGSNEQTLTTQISRGVAVAEQSGVAEQSASERDLPAEPDSEESREPISAPSDHLSLHLDEQPQPAAERHSVATDSVEVRAHHTPSEEGSLTTEEAVVQLSRASGAEAATVPHSSPGEPVTNASSEEEPSIVQQARGEITQTGPRVLTSSPPNNAAQITEISRAPHTENVNHANRSSQLRRTQIEQPTASLALESAKPHRSEPEEHASQQVSTSFQRPPPNSATTAPSSFPFQTQLPRPGSSGLPQSSLRTGSPIRLFSTLQGRASSQPLGESSPQVSSPIASVPSHTIGTIGESAPPRPATLPSPLGIGSARSTRAMGDSQFPGTPKSSLLDKLKAMREQRRASRQASVPTSAPMQDSKPPIARSQASTFPLSQPPKAITSLVTEEQSRRSPSAVPAMEPPAIVTQEEMNTSERYETLLPQSQANGSRMSISGATLSRQPSKVQDALLSNSYVVPIPFVGHQRDQYTSITETDMKVIERFLATTTPEVQLVRKAERLVEEKRQIALHPDLVNGETMTPYDVRPEQEAQWYVDCSVKFRFLKELLDGVRDQTLHIAIVTQPGRILDMLDKFLTGIHMPHRRMHDVATVSLASEDQGLMITIVSVRDDVHEAQPSPADLIIALGPTITAECLPIRALTHGEKQAPLATLVVPYTIEHLEQSISPALPEHTRLRTLVSGFNHYRHDAGRLEEEHLGLAPAAKALGAYLVAGQGGQGWPLPTLAPLENLDSQTESDIEPPVTQDEELLEAATGTKRPLELDGTAPNGSETAKKARIGPAAAEGNMQEFPATINPQELEITRISDSVTKPTQAVSTATGTAAWPTLSDAEQSLQRMLQETQARLDEHVHALSEVQFRNEDLRQQLVAITITRNGLTATAQGYYDRATSAETKFFALRAEHSELKQQLVDAKARALEHSVPERAEFETLRLKVEKTEVEKAQMEKRLAGVNKDHEFLREQYQTISQRAQALLSQATDLEVSLAAAQTLATGEHAKLRQMGYDAQTKSLRDENKKVKAILGDRDAAVKFRDEEIARLKEAARGRMGTRGTSVPRSPRLGSPMRMGDGGGATPRGRGSRQGSPAAGEVKGKGAGLLHPLRNVG